MAVPGRGSDGGSSYPGRMAAGRGVAVAVAAAAEAALIGASLAVAR